MSPVFYLVVHTANILGIFTDPFEFEGDYGPEVNPIRQKVFEQVGSQEALIQHLSDSEIETIKSSRNLTEDELDFFLKKLLNEAIARDREHGPLLSELISSDSIQLLIAKQKELENDGFSAADLEAILQFIQQYADQKIYYFLRHNPPELLSLDKTLRDQAARVGRDFDLPILGSMQKLEGQNAEEIKLNLLERVFTVEILGSTKPQDKVISAIQKINQQELQKYLGAGAHIQDLYALTTPAGQTFFYWLYHAMNLHLISQEASIEEVNQVKAIFAETLGNAEVRAQNFKQKLMAADTGVLFTQESDSWVPELLLQNGFFLPIAKQNPKDGAFVLLRSDLWEANYQIIPIANYDGYLEGRMNVILATHKFSGEKFLLAACHGHSTKAEDGRMQISLVMDKFHELAELPENNGLQVIIGIDANTKTEPDVHALQLHLDKLGLTSTKVGPTTIKRRLVTAQHSKAGKFAMDEEDYIIVLKPGAGGRFTLTKPTVGFSEIPPDLTQTLPNINNPSDHYPVGVTLM